MRLEAGSHASTLAEAPGYFDVRSWGDKSGREPKWAWRMIDGAGRTIAQSVTPFDARAEAEAAISWIQTDAASCPVRFREPPKYHR